MCSRLRLCSGHQAVDSAGWASWSLQPLQPGSGSVTSPGLLELLHGLYSTVKVPAPALAAIPGPLGICGVRHSEVVMEDHCLQPYAALGSHGSIAL